MQLVYILGDDVKILSLFDEPFLTLKYGLMTLRLSKTYLKTTEESFFFVLTVGID